MLPEKWYLKGGVELSTWIQEKEKAEDIPISVYGGYVTKFYILLNPCDLTFWRSGDLENLPTGYTEITLEEFEKYVLNKTPKVEEDMSYLIKVLKRCNIK